MRSSCTFTILLLLMVTAAPMWGQSPLAHHPVDPERSRRFSELPLDGKDVTYIFDIGAEGAGVAVTAHGHDTDVDIGDHITWRVHRLSTDAARCDFSAPEFGNIESSQEVRALCDPPRPLLRVITRNFLRGYHFEIESVEPHWTAQVQQLVRLMAAKHPEAALFTTPSDPKESASEVTRLENQWAEAQKAGDADAVAPLLHENFITTDVSGHSYNKKELLATLKGGKWESNGISDVKVSVYGDTAIATGAWAGKGVDGDGTRIDRRERWTDTWVKTKSGPWQCVASHASEVKQW